MDDEMGLPCQWAKLCVENEVRIGLYISPGSLDTAPEIDGHLFKLTGSPSDAWVSDEEVEWMTGDAEIEAQLRFVLEGISSDRDFSSIHRNDASRLLALPIGDVSIMETGVFLLKSAVVDGLPMISEGSYAEQKNDCVGDTSVSWRWMTKLAQDTVDKCMCSPSPGM